MGIDCEFRAINISDVKVVRALPGVLAVYRPSETSFCPPDRWVITSMIRWVGEGCDPRDDLEDRAPRVAALLRALRANCTGLEYGGDNGVPFEEVTDALILEIEGQAARSSR